MFTFETNRPQWRNDLMDEIRLFFPEPEKTALSVTHTFAEGETWRNSVVIDGVVSSFDCAPVPAENTLIYERLSLRSAKTALYKALEGHTGRRLPWGSLTGIRPTKLAYDMLGEGISRENIAAELEKRFFVSPEKARLVSDILDAQKGVLTSDERLVNLYVHIPFCTSRCRYCSFTTAVLDKAKSLVGPYAEALCEEIAHAADMIAGWGKRVHSVYVGGGTPTAPDARTLSRILDAIPYRGIEYTVEAGRPDTVTAEKLDALKAHGVTRISVNPQTLCDETLMRIGRSHTAADFLDKYELARSYGFVVNTDLIAGLEGERLSDFRKTVDGIVALRPHNVTVHTLSRKNGAKLKEETDYADCPEISDMTDYAREALTAAGYLPYYLYRQKQMLGNLENTGYTLPGFQCVNNVTTMEEALSVVACGAGGISKRVIPSEGRIERLANLRDVRLYIEQKDERLIKKRIFYEK